MSNDFIQIGEPEGISPELDLFEEIDRLKVERNAIVLAHYYQEPDIQDIPTFLPN